jgi:hypothetical protein
LDGLFVVQWEQNRVQDLLTGKYHPYSDERFGSAVTEWELNQLKSKSIVEQYDNDYVYLTLRPDETVNPLANRTFYIYTHLEKGQQKWVEQQLEEVGLADRFAVRVRDQYIAIRGQAGATFPDFMVAERERELLVQKLPTLFEDAAIAFVELTNAM